MQTPLSIRRESAHGKVEHETRPLRLRSVDFAEAANELKQQMNELEKIVAELDEARTVSHHVLNLEVSI
jgi:hypothetical protein